MSEKKWLAAHLYYGEPWQPLLVNGIKPLVENILEQGLADNFFFIRYWERGPHIRLRFLTDESRKTVLEPKLVAWFREYIAAHPSQRNFPEPAKGPPLYPNNSIHFIPYQPETERYGGPAGLSVSEKQFEASSHTTLAVLAGSGEWNYDRALGSAIQLHLGFAHAVGMDLVESGAFFQATHASYRATFLAAYAEGERESLTRAFQDMFDQQSDVLVPFCRSLWNGLANGAEFDQVWFDSWLRHMAALYRELQAFDQAGRLSFTWKWPKTAPAGAVSEEQKSLWRLFTSYIHMTNNRLGILNQDEAYLAFLLARVAKCL